MQSKVTRRNVLISLAATAFQPPSVSFALSDCSPYKDENITGLLNGFGFPVGSQDHKHDMVALVAPWCPICLSLLDDARQGLLPFNLYAIPCEPINTGDKIRIAEACFAQDDEARLVFHSRAELPKKTLTVDEMNFVNSVQRLTLDIALNYAERFQKKQPKGFPTLYLKSSDGFWATAGYKREILMAEIKTLTPSSLKPSFINRDRLRQAMHRKRSGKTYRLLEPNSRYRIFPTANALTGACYGPPLGFDADYEVVVDGKAWLEVDLGSQSSFIAASDVQEV